MTISITLRLPGQTIPRPFSRACSESEMVELIQSYVRRVLHDECDGPRQIFPGNTDQELPVCRISYKGQGTAEFFAFTEGC